jgi:hypothetical protein
MCQGKLAAGNKMSMGLNGEEEVAKRRGKRK